MFKIFHFVIAKLKKSCFLFFSKHGSKSYCMNKLREVIIFAKYDLQVLLGDMGTEKTSLVLRFIKGQFYDHQVNVQFLFLV